MSRYIDAEKILPYISRLLGAMPVAVLKMAETDGVEIVFCTECRYAHTSECPIRDTDWEFKELDFCSYGEREGE